MFRFQRSPRPRGCAFGFPSFGGRGVGCLFSSLAAAQIEAAAEAGQRLPLAGVHDLRDLGGYRGADGRANLLETPAG